MTLPSLYREVIEMRAQLRSQHQAMHQQVWQTLNAARKHLYDTDVTRRKTAQQVLQQRLTQRQTKRKMLYSQLEVDDKALRQVCMQGRMYRAEMRRQRIAAMNHLLERDMPISDPTPTPTPLPSQEKPIRPRPAKGHKA